MTRESIDYFVSDVHLAAGRPFVTDLFLRFCDHARRDATRLFLLGDIFDLWVGQKQQRLSYVGPIVSKLRDLSRSGIELHFVAGNRDFNFDLPLDDSDGPVVVEDSMSIQSAGRRLFLTHGDLLCTGDVAYGRARAILRSAPARAAAGSLPLALTTFLSTGYRRLSERETARKTRLEIAVNFGRVRSHLTAGHDVVVSGHVHRAARYEVDLDGGTTGEFITLGEWGRKGSYMEARNGQLKLRVWS